MPTYDFFCTKCEKTFSVIISISEYEKKKYRCPLCKGKEIEQQISSFQTVTSKKSQMESTLWGALAGCIMGGRFGKYGDLRRRKTLQRGKRERTKLERAKVTKLNDRLIGYPHQAQKYSTSKV